MIYRFENPEYLYLLLVVPVLIFGFWLTGKIKRKNRVVWGEWKLTQRIIPAYSKIRPVIKYSLAILSVILLISGLSNFQIGSKTEEQTTEGAEIVFALDVSNSMLAEDVAPSRLQFAKSLIDQLSENLQDDRVGLVIFAGESFNQLPLTNDKSLLYATLSSVSTGSVPAQGTAIGSALETSLKLFDNSTQSGKAIVLFTDGEDHESYAVQQAQIARDSKIVIHTIGIGSLKGAPIPVGQERNKVVFKNDQRGKRIISKLNTDLLREIAGVTGGNFIHANDSKVSFEPVVEEVKSMERRKFSETKFTNFQHRFQYFIGATLLLLIVDLFIFEGKRKLADKV